MYEPTVDPDEGIEREMVSSSREVSAGFVPFATLDVNWAVGQITRSKADAAKPARDRRPPVMPGPLFLSGLARPKEVK